MVLLFPRGTPAFCCMHLSPTTSSFLKRSLSQEWNMVWHSLMRIQDRIGQGWPHWEGVGNIEHLKKLPEPGFLWKESALNCIYWDPGFAINCKVAEKQKFSTSNFCILFFHAKRRRSIWIKKLCATPKLLGVSQLVRMHQNSSNLTPIHPIVHTCTLATTPYCIRTLTHVSPPPHF